MSRARKVLEGFGLGLANQACVALVGLWLARFTLHHLGEHDYGLWLIGAQFLAYLGILDFGVTAILPREVARVTGEAADPAEREAKLREVIADAVSVILWTVLVIAIASTALIVLLPDDWSSLRGPLAIALGAYVLTYPLRIAHSVLTGIQELAFLGVVQLATWAIGVVVTIVLIVMGYGMYSVAAGPATSSVVAGVAWLVRVLRRHRELLPRRVRVFDLVAARKHAGPGGWVTLNQVAHLLLNSTDVTILGRMLGPASVVIYSFTDKAETMLNTQVYALATMAGPALVELRASGDKRRFGRAVSAVSAIVLVFSGAVFVGIVAANRAFVRVWVGDEHFGGMILTVVLVINMLLRHWTFTYGSTAFFIGREREVTLFAIADGVLTVILSILFVRIFGIVGAPLGAIAALVLTQTPGCIYLLARDLGIPLTTLVQDALPWLLRFVPIAAIAWVFGARFGATSLGKVALVGAITLVIYLLAMFPLVRRPPLDTYAAPYAAKFARIRALFSRTAPRPRA